MNYRNIYTFTVFVQQTSRGMFIRKLLHAFRKTFCNMFYFVLLNMNRIDPQYYGNENSWLIVRLTNKKQKQTWTWITDIHLVAHVAKEEIIIFESFNERWTLHLPTPNAVPNVIMNIFLERLNDFLQHFDASKNGILCTYIK